MSKGTKLPVDVDYLASIVIGLIPRVTELERSASGHTNAIQTCFARAGEAHKRIDALALQAKCQGEQRAKDMDELVQRVDRLVQKVTLAPYVVRQWQLPPNGTLVIATPFSDRRVRIVVQPED